MKLNFPFAVSFALLFIAVSATTNYIRPESSSERVIIPFPEHPTSFETQGNCPHLDPGLLDWHNPTTWPSGNVPGAGTYDDVITVPENTRILISQSMPDTVHGKIYIPATSEVVIGESSSDEIEIHAHGIQVAGGLVAGSESCEIQDTKIRIVLHGTRPDDIMSNPQEPAFKGIAVTGELSLHGKRYFNTWSRLSATASPGDISLLLQHNVNWESGQEILLVTTAIKDSREWHQNEVFTIDSVESNPQEQGGFGTKVNIIMPVEYTHLANFAYQAEVGLLTRMIVIEGYEGDSEPTDPDDLLCILKNNKKNYGVPDAPCTDKSLTGFGAHVIVMHTGVGQVQGVELHRVGQTNVMGRYPMHFHMLGDCPQCYFKASSVHRSYYRCATIHGTNQATVTENVFYDAIGNCLYMEDGVEMFNTISYNLGAHVHMIGPAPATGGAQYIDVVRQSEKLLVPSDVAAVVFYITNAHNNVIGNAASGGWAGFGFPILYDCLGPSKGCGFRPANVLPLTIDGNSAHSTGWWWYHTGGFYLSGSLYYDADGTTMLYNAGRDFEYGKRDNCAENQCLTGDCAKACPTHLQRSLTISNSKTFLIPGVGANSWLGGVDWLGFESHDNGMALEALSRGFWVDNMLVNCRTGDKIEFPPGGKATKMKGTGFFWYATGQLHIITNSHFRRCGYRGGGKMPEFDQYDTALNRGCGDDAETGCRDDSTTFGFPVHNDIDTPEVMQGTKAISFENCGRRFFLRDRRYMYEDYAQSTMSARASNWIDSDGSASGLNEPVFMGSGKKDAGLWWKVDDSAVYDEHGPLWFIKKNDGPERGLGHMKLSFDPAMHAKAGKTICTGPGVPDNPCPYLGKIRHMGHKYQEDEGLPITANPDVAGLVGGYSWLLSFYEGSPIELLISEIEVYPDTPMMLSVPYPPGVPVTITAHSKHCKDSKKYTCTEVFHEVDSIDAVRHSEGNAYYRHAEDGLLTIRIIMFSSKFTGNPTWIKPDFDTPGKKGVGLAIDSFQRADITIPQKNANAWISVVADCTPSTINVAYCADEPDSNINPDVCPEGYSQSSYDTCCIDEFQCVHASE